MKNLEEIIKVSKGDELADLVIKNAKLVNVLSEEIYETDIAIIVNLYWFFAYLKLFLKRPILGISIFLRLYVTNVIKTGFELLVKYRL